MCLAIQIAIVAYDNFKIDFSFADNKNRTIVSRYKNSLVATNKSKPAENKFAGFALVNGKSCGEKVCVGLIAIRSGTSRNDSILRQNLRNNFVGNRPMPGLLVR